ncbi:hypothetical protein EKN06_08495 [Croceicoccus ponticola]|uniref:F420-dependent oxidoreductase n=1 Tax=Croceicoccus ponticola TaxID=2217664 RepID=A0A437GX54_9SPHN|nr:Pr6Pr family membrane protein [Croceicoccus ponticola]RVQ66975.1 hypothetical protein EKN06_08495 [Croceicoccus ponticola]
MTRSISADRIAAIIIAIVGLTNFALQIVLSIEKTGSLVGAFLVLTRFFTILTNAAVVFVMLRIANSRHVGGGVLLALVTAIAMVALVYHAILADLQTFTGLNMVTDQGFHTVIPILTLLWWVAFGGRLAAGWRDLVWVLPWPIAYCAVALVRGAASGVYPYPFLDLPKIGWTALLINVVGLAIAFLITGGFILGIARLRR